MALNKKQIKHLKAVAHNRKPVVTIGNKGVSASVIEEIKIALEHHELIKIKLPAIERKDRLAMANQVSDGAGADLVSIIGRVAIFFLPSSDSSFDFPV